MRKVLLTTALLLMVAGLLAQVAIDPRSGFANIRETRAPQEIEIQIKAMIPDISVVQIKTDTYSEPGEYNYTIDLGVIQEESKKQLHEWQQEINNWLEESK